MSPYLNIHAVHRACSWHLLDKYGTKLHVDRVEIEINNMKMTALVLFVLDLVCFLVLLDIRNIYLYLINFLCTLPNIDTHKLSVGVSRLVLAAAVSVCGPFVSCM